MNVWSPGPNQPFTIEQENDNAEVNRIILRPFQNLLRRSKAAGVLIHHVGKVSENGDRQKIYRSRGASSIAAKARLILDLSADSRGEDCVIVTCAKIKGEKFPDTILRLNSKTRWFEFTDDTPSPKLSGYQKFLGLIDHRMRTGEIKNRAVQNDFKIRTTEALLRMAVARGDLSQPKRGVYEPRK